MIQRIICLAIGYCFGLIQTGYIYGKLHGMDIRSVGSGNAGSTNMLRTFGLKAGVVTLLCDALKAACAIFVSWLLFHNSHPDIMPLLKVYAGAGAVLGHDFPFYMNFKGGKGIAATAGLVIGLLDPVLFFLGLVTFFTIFFTTHYVSLGSLAIYTGLVIESVIMGERGIGQFARLSQSQRIEVYAILFLLMVLAYWQHRANIQRLLQNRERKTFLDLEKNRQEAERFKSI